MDNTKVISTLNWLIETLKDGEEGFRTAAEGLTDPQTKAVFQQYSRERAQMAQELQAEVRALGGDPEQGGQHVRLGAPRLDQHQVGRDRQERREHHRRG